MQHKLNMSLLARLMRKTRRKMNQSIRMEAEQSPSYLLKPVRTARTQTQKNGPMKKQSEKSTNQVLTAVPANMNAVRQYSVLTSASLHSTSLVRLLPHHATPTH